MSIDNITRQFERADWMAHAKCAGLDTATRNRLFFPPQGSNANNVRRAKDICRSCPIEAQCLEYALVNEERFGIWGGKSEKERRVLRAKRSGRPTPTIVHGTLGGYAAHHRHDVPMCEPCRLARKAHALKYRAAS